MKKITSKSLIWIGIGLLISALFFIYGIKNFNSAFSEASLDFKLSRDEIKTKATRFLETRGYEIPDDYYNTISFSEDTDAKTFIDKEFGLERLQEMNDEGYKIWFWEVRRFKPLSKEEYSVCLNTEGKLKSFRHLYEEERAVPSISLEEAKSAAEEFLKSVAGLNIEDLELKEEKQITQPNRIDYKFEWELKSFSAGKSSYRYLVKVQGNEVGEYDEFLKVPEDWQRNFTKLRSQNTVYQTIANIFFVILFIIIIVNFVYRLVKRDLKLKLAFKLGILVFILQLLSQLNMYPFYLSGYNVNQSFSSFILSFILSGVASGLLQGFMIFLAVASGETIYRQYFKDKIQMTELFKFKGFKLSETFYGSIWGYILAMFHLGFVILFYKVSTSLGAWAPASTQYSEMVNTWIPWIFPLTIGVMASVSEEFIFRVFAIPFLKKITNSNFIAVVIPAFLWGFLHSNYPQQPGYIRGIEVGIIGIIAGIIMIRYGILATLIWHYAIDAALVGMFLFGSKNLYFIISGVIVVGVVFIPFIWVLISYLKKKEFSDEEEILNKQDEFIEDEKKIEEEKSEEAESFPEYIPINKITVGLMTALLVISILWISLVKGGNPVDFGFKLSQTIGNAKVNAENFLKEKGVKTEEFNVGYGLGSKYSGHIYQENLNYLRESMSVKEAEDYIVKYLSPANYYIVHFFKQDELNSYFVYVSLNGDVIRYKHSIDEDAPGKTISREDAEELVNAVLNEKFNYTPGRLELIDNSSIIRKNRTDHNFTWKDTEAQINEAYPKITADVIGDEVVVSGPALKIPEKWEIEKYKQTAGEIILSVLFILFLGLLTALAIFTFFANLNKTKVPIKKIFTFALLIALIKFTIGLLAYRNNLVNFQTSIQLLQYTIILFGSKFVGALFQGALIGCLAIIVYEITFINTSIVSIIPFKGTNSSRYFGDSLLAGLTSAAVIFSFMKFYNIISINLNKPNIPVLLSSPNFINYSFMGLGLFLSGIITVILTAFLLYILHFIIQKYFNFKIWVIYFVVLSAVFALQISKFNMSEFLYLLWLFLIVASALLIILMVFLKDNFSAYLFTAFFIFAGYSSYFMVKNTLSCISSIDRYLVQNINLT